MVLDKTDDVVLLGSLNQLVVVSEQLHRGLSNEDVELTLNSVQRDGVVSTCNIS